MYCIESILWKKEQNCLRYALNFFMSIFYFICVQEDVFVKCVKEKLRGSLQLDVLKSSCPPSSTSTSITMAKQKRMMKTSTSSSSSSTTTTTTTTTTTKLSIRERMKQHLEAKTKVLNNTTPSQTTSTTDGRMKKDSCVEESTAQIPHENVDPNLL
jgi:hypothetical protein